MTDRALFLASQSKAEEMKMMLNTKAKQVIYYTASTHIPGTVNKMAQNYTAFQNFLAAAQHLTIALQEYYGITPMLVTEQFFMDVGEIATSPSARIRFQLTCEMHKRKVKRGYLQPTQFARAQLK